MDLSKHYNNRNLESRRKQLLRVQEAEAAMRRRKDRRADNRAQILAAFALVGERGDRNAAAGRDRDFGPLSNAIVCYLGSRKRPLRVVHREGIRQLLLRVELQTNLLDDIAVARSVLELSRRYDCWLRQPEDWAARSHNARRQFASLARHLLARYDVPAFIDAAWDLGRASCGPHQEWFVHIGRGGNIRKAAGLPLPLTKLMAHHFLLAPDECSIPEALRWGQLRGMGAGERLARAILGSRLGGAFAGADREPFLATVFNFLVLHPMIDPHQVGPIIDYLHHQKFVPAGPVNVGGGTFVEQGPPQPGLSMKGRTPEALVQQVTAWHRKLGRVRGGANLTWPSCGIPGYDRVEGEPGNQRRFFVTELLSSAELRAEGAAMHHCVGTYAGSCHSGRTAIYSLKMDGAGVALTPGPERRVTIEVDVRTRQITQVRTRHNAPSTPLDQRVLSAWATTASLTFSRFALERRY